MKKSMMVSLCAGMAFAGAAMAQDVAVPVTRQIQRVPSENMGGATVIATRTNQAIYSNVDGNYLTNGALPRMAMDNTALDITLTGAVTYPLNINGANVGFDMPIATDFDLEVTVWSTWSNSASGVPMHSDEQGGYILQVRGLAAGTYETGMVDLSGIGGIDVNDGGLFVRIRFLMPDSQTDLVPSGNVQMLYANSMDPATFSTTKVGWSNSNHWRDANGDGILDNVNDAARQFAWPNSTDLYIQLQADVPALGGNPCPADFNGDQFLDFFDIDAYIEAFEIGC